MSDFNANQLIAELLNSHKVFIFAKSYCPYCRKVEDMFNAKKVEFGVLDLDKHENGAEIQRALTELTGQSTVPYVYIDKKFIGGAEDTLTAESSGKLTAMLSEAGITVTSSA